MLLPINRQQFRFPPGMDDPSKITYCLDIISKYKKELPFLRIGISHLRQQKDKAEKEIKYWRNRYVKEKLEREKVQKDNDKLKEEIERISKTKRRYQIALFDHGNFQSQSEKSDKTKGGQIGHKDTNREAHTDYSSFTKKRVYAKVCGKCGHQLFRAKAAKQKILLDIVINPQLVKLILESERQWCPRCQKEVNAKDPRTLPFTEYGLNTFMLTLILRFSCHASFANIASVFSLCHGLTISKSEVSNILSQAKGYLSSRYDKLLKAVRQGKVVYLDETGWLVNGESAWMWIMTGEKETIYFAAESRGKGIAEELYGESTAYAMHDGLASYHVLPGSKGCTCWSHFLRFIHEETAFEKKDSPAILLRDELVNIYQIKGNHPEFSLKELERKLRCRLSSVLKLKPKDPASFAILKRLKGQKEELINSLLYTKDGTNNLAEQELRTMVLNKKVSSGSDTFSGMETTAVLGSIMRTLSRKEKNIISDLTCYFQEGIKEKYFQYFHPILYNTS